MVQVNFDSKDAPPPEPFGVLPAGEYVVVLDKAERKDLKKRDGARLACTFSVIRGEYEGRKLFGSFNLWIEGSDEAKRIAEREFSGLIQACGKLAVGDTDELMGIPVIAVVKVRAASGGYDEQNEIKAFKLEDGSNPTPDVAKPAASTGKAWQKKG